MSDPIVEPPPESERVVRKRATEPTVPGKRVERKPASPHRPVPAQRVVRKRAAPVEVATERIVRPPPAAPRAPTKDRFGNPIRAAIPAAQEV